MCYRSNKYIFILVIIAFNVINLFGSLDSLLTRLDTVEKEDKVSLLLDIAYAHSELLQYDLAKEYGVQALSLSRSLKSDVLTARILYFFGFNNEKITSNEEALENLWEAAEIFEEYNDEKSLAWVYNQIGIIYEILIINEKALMYYTKAQRIFEKLKDERSLAGIYNNLGNMYFEMNDADRALQAYKVSVEVNKKFDNLAWAAGSLFNISIIFSSQKKYNQSLDYLERSLQLYQSLKDTTSYFIIYASMADTYSELGMCDSADVYLDKARGLRKAMLPTNNELILTYQFAFNLYKQGKFVEALDFFAKAEKLAVDIDDQEFLSLIIEKMGECYSGLGMFENAYYYIQKHLAIEDSLKEMDKIALLIQKQKEFEMEKFQDKILLEGEKEKIQIRSKILHARLIGGLLFTIVVALILAIYLFYRNSRLQKNNNQILSESNENKNKLISILSHDMKNSLYSIKSGTRILAEDVDKLNKDDIKMFAKELYKSTENVYGFMENVLLWMKSQADKLEVTNQDLNLHFLVTRVFDLLESAAVLKNLQLINEIKEEEMINADKDMLEFIIRNLIQNAIKYSYKNGIIKVVSEIKDNKIEISVIDNGIGIPQDKIKTLFTSSNRYSRKGTSNEKGTGLGLVICKDFVSKMRGSIHCESSEDSQSKGSSFHIRLPLN